MTLRLLCLTLIILISLSLSAQAEQAAVPKQLGSFGSWKAYASEGDKPVCYMTMAVHFPPDKKIKRGDAFLMITHRPGDNSKDVVSYKAGYNFKSSSDVTAVINKKSFDLFTDKDTAWSRDALTDHAFAAAIRTGSTLKVTGQPAAKGLTSVSDAIPLKGAGPAYAAISKACGYPVETTPAGKAAPTNKKTKTH